MLANVNDRNKKSDYYCITILDLLSLILFVCLKIHAMQTSSKISSMNMF